MEKFEKNTQNDDSIDILYFVKALWRKAWAILLITLLCGGGAFGFTKLFVKPKYSSSVLLYVNNGDISISGITVSQLSAAQSLVDTYIAILDNRTTMQEIQKTAAKSDSSLGEDEINWKKIKGAITAEAVEGTELFKITATTTSPEKSEILANSAATVLSLRVESIIDGCSVKLVDAAVDGVKVSPNSTRGALIGVVCGFLAACALFVVLAMLDDTIQNEDTVVDMYNVPMLAKIPNLVFESKAYGSYKSYRKSYRYKTLGDSPEQSQQTESEGEKL